MGRLIKEVLYHPRSLDEHLYRTMRTGEMPSEGIDIEKGWETLADRIRKIDPRGFKSYELHLEILRKE